MQHRDLGLLKLTFGSVASPEARAALCRDQLAVHGERLRAYETYAAVPMDPFLAATLELGLRYERAAVDLWQSLHDRLAAAEPRPG